MLAVAEVAMNAAKAVGMAVMRELMIFKNTIKSKHSPNKEQNDIFNSEIPEIPLFQITGDPTPLKK